MSKAEIEELGNRHAKVDSGGRELDRSFKTSWKRASKSTANVILNSERLKHFTLRSRAR